VIRILLADDHRMIRQGLKSLLEKHVDMKVVGEAENGRDAVAMVAEHKPDVVVMDLHMPELNGVDATRGAMAAHPGVKVICLSAHANERMTAEILKAGASGYVLKEGAFEELNTAIRTACGGKVYLSPSVASMLVNDLVRGRGEPASVFSTLSNREREVLQLITEGKTTKEIAFNLHVSVKTAETHRRNLMEKLQIDSIAELTKFALREGLTSL
jgi:DNA-binding NarL/FixJ family response regulator